MFAMAYVTKKQTACSSVKSTLESVLIRVRAKAGMNFLQFFLYLSFDTEILSESRKQTVQPCVKVDAHSVAKIVLRVFVYVEIPKQVPIIFAARKGSL